MVELSKRTQKAIDKTQDDIFIVQGFAALKKQLSSKKSFVSYKKIYVAVSFINAIIDSALYTLRLLTHDRPHSIK